MTTDNWSAARTRDSPSASLTPPTPPHSATTNPWNGAEVIGTYPSSGGATRRPVPLTAVRPIDSADHHHRRPFRSLAHHQNRRCGHSIGKGDLGRVEPAAERSVSPRRSITAAGPAMPIATPVLPMRQGRPKLSDTITPIWAAPSASNRCRRSRAERSGSSGRSRI